MPGVGLDIGAAAVGMARTVASNGTTASGTAHGEGGTTFLTLVRGEVAKVARFACLLFFACAFFAAFYRGFMWLFYDRHAGKRRAKPTRATPV